MQGIELNISELIEDAVSKLPNEDIHAFLGMFQEAAIRESWFCQSWLANWLVEILGSEGERRNLKTFKRPEFPIQECCNADLAVALMTCNQLVKSTQASEFSGFAQHLTAAVNDIVVAETVNRLGAK